MKALKKNTVIKVIAEELLISQEQAAAATNLARDLGTDELDMIAIVNKLEGRSGREVTARELEELKTVQDIVSLFCARMEPVAA